MALGAVFVSGLVFALGLGISGMTDANKVIAFLNLAGEWDPSLAFVMLGAIGVHMPLIVIIRGRGKPIFGEMFHLPTRQDLGWPLLVGSAVFGAGWGLGGFCPGPGIVSSMSLIPSAGLFTVAMLGGMRFARYLQPAHHIDGESTNASLEFDDA